MPRVTLPADFDEPVFAAFAEHIGQITPGDELPPLSALDLMEIHLLAPQVYILDVIRDGAAAPWFKVRFAGTETVTALELEPTGKSLSDINIGPERDDVVRIYTDMLETRRPSASRSGFLIEAPKVLSALGQQTVVLKRLVFPFTNAGQSIDHFVGVLTRFDGLGEQTGFVKIDL